MINFYGRKTPRKVNKNDLLSLFNDEFFFHHKNIKNFNKLIPKDSLLNLEIGFGSGENIFKSAVKYSDEFFLGCDPYLKGSLSLKKQIKQSGIKNLILTNLSFQEFFKYIKKYTFSRILILFPDPWPKKKHMKRRIISKPFLKIYTQYVIKSQKSFYHPMMLIMWNRFCTNSTWIKILSYRQVYLEKN